MNTWINKTTSLFTGLAMAFLVTADVSAAEGSTSITKSYRKYSYDTNSCTNYSLTINNNSFPQPRSITYPDGRVRDGNDGIVRLSSGGTGFIVGDHTIATAAHCVNVKHSSNQSLKTRYQSSWYFHNDLEIFTYNETGIPENAPSLTPVEIHIPNEYYNNDTLGSDYALITVEEDLSEYTHFNLGVPYNVANAGFRSLDLFVSGIPETIPDTNPNDSIPPEQNSSNLMYTSKGKIDSIFESTDEYLCYSCDTVGGDSGGPVYTAYQFSAGSITSTAYTVVAIHNLGHFGGVPYNRGSAITPYKIQFYLNNSNALY